MMPGSRRIGRGHSISIFRFAQAHCVLGALPNTGELSQMREKRGVRERNARRSFLRAIFCRRVVDGDLG